MRPSLSPRLDACLPDIERQVLAILAALVGPGRDKFKAVDACTILVNTIRRMGADDALLKELLDGEPEIDHQIAYNLVRGTGRFARAIDCSRHLMRLSEMFDTPKGSDGEELPLTEEEVTALIRDPRYWRDRDPAIVQRVTEAFRKLYPNALPHPAEAGKCQDGALPDGPTCPKCGGERAPSGVGGGSWVHVRKS